MLRTNITKEIFNQREEYINFLEKMFSLDKRFHFFFHLVMDWGNIKDTSILEEFCGADQYYQILQLAADHHLHMPVYRFFLKPFRRICYAAKKNSFVISSDGAIRKCTQRLYDNSNFLVNIKEHSRIDEYNWDFGNYDLDSECENCKLLPLCMGLVCPMYTGKKTDACGTELTDINTLLKIVVRSENMKVENMDE